MKQKEILHLPQEIQNLIQSYFLIDKDCSSPTASIIKDYWKQLYEKQLKDLQNIFRKLSEEKNSKRIERIYDILNNCELVKSSFIPKNSRFIKNLINTYNYYYEIDFFISYAQNNWNYAKRCFINEEIEDLENLLEEFYRLLMDLKNGNLDENKTFLK